MIRTAIIASACLALTACFEMTAVSTSPQEALASIAVEAERGADHMLRVQVRPGRDENGVHGTYADDALLVEGAPHAPVEILSDGIRAYQLSGQFGASGTVTIQLPALIQSGRPAELALSLLQVVAPDTLVVRHGEDIEIALEGASGVNGSDSDFWRIELVADDGVALTLSRRGELPDAIRLPSGILPETTSSGRIRITAASSTERSLPPYRTFIQRRAGASIRFRMTP